MNLPNRKSIRLPDYDYTRNGAYYVTICTHERQRLFGQIKERQMILSGAGWMLLSWIEKLPIKYPGISLDVHAVMPDHIHLVLFFENSKYSLGEVLRWLKTQSTNEYIRGVKNGLYVPFQKRVWQRNYYEHVIRNSEDLMEIRNYVQFNDAK